MKKLISLFFLVIICIQCLPIKELGKGIFDSSFVEDDVCDGLEKKEIKDFAKELSSTEFNIEGVSPITTAYNNEHMAFYQNPFADLSIKPPCA